MKRPHRHPSDANAIADLFDDDVSKCKPEENPAQPHQFSRRNAPIAMPNRGFLYSEVHRLACELRALKQYEDTLKPKEWNDLWLMIAKYRGQEAAIALAEQYAQSRQVQQGVDAVSDL